MKRAEMEPARPPPMVGFILAGRCRTSALQRPVFRIINYNSIFAINCQVKNFPKNFPKNLDSQE